MLETWEGGWDGGSSCYWTLGREAGIVDLHVGQLGGRLGWALGRETGIMEIYCKIQAKMQKKMIIPNIRKIKNKINIFYNL